MVSHPSNGSAKMNLKNKNNSLSHNQNQAVATSFIAIALGKILIFTYGLMNWFLFLFAALRSGKFFDKPTEKEKNKLAIARDAFWNLSKQPTPGFNHNFFKTRSGLQLHYICNHDEKSQGKDLIILIHGFPNSCMIWRYLLQEPALPIQNATIVAVDLPGFGGSDSMFKYDTEVLEHLTEFIVAMRDQYGTGGDSIGNTFVVGHDWGCVIAMLLAAEASSLADRFIFSNGPLINLVRSNIERSLGSSKRIFKQFQASPRANFGCLAKSYNTLKPFLWQLVLSGYIFVFQLPYIFLKLLSEGGNSIFLRRAYSMEHGSSSDEYKGHESMAANLGPGPHECNTETVTGARYSSSVAQRAGSVGVNFWNTTAYYRDGLSTDHWDKSLETIAALYNLDSDLSSSDSPARRRSSSAASPLFNDYVAGSIRAPSTMIWGEQDLALSRTICLDGIGDYLTRDSEVILLPGVGHWPQTEKNSRNLLAQILAMFANGKPQTPSYIIKQVQEIDSRASLIAKK